MPWNIPVSSLEVQTHNPRGYPNDFADHYTAKHNVDHLQGTQITESESHPDWGQRHKAKFHGKDIGGRFFTSKQYVEGDMPTTHLGGKEYWGQFGDIVTTSNFSGSMFPCSPALLHFPDVVPTPDRDLDALGTTAIARCKPTNSVANASVFLTELVREGIPNLIGQATLQWRDVTKKARKAPAKDYLTYEFGWKPIYNDAQKFLNAVRRGAEVLRQYERDADRLVRRQYAFPSETLDSSFTLFTNGYPSVPVSNSSMTTESYPGSTWRIHEHVRRRWFSGGFVYHLPRNYNSRSELDRYALMATKVYGLTLTPDVLWNVAPWSWAVDWVSNTGDVISNLSSWATDSLVLKYGYIMETQILRDTYVYVGSTGFKPETTFPPPITLVTEIKSRRKATPFGFGLKWGDFTPRQLAIAASLGLTHS